jgi:hypothetical protein
MLALSLSSVSELSGARFWILSWALCYRIGYYNSSTVSLHDRSSNMLSSREEKPCLTELCLLSRFLLGLPCLLHYFFWYPASDNLAFSRANIRLSYSCFRASCSGFSFFSLDYFDAGFTTFEYFFSRLFKALTEFNESDESD